jgi:hypothetical protein
MSDKFSDSEEGRDAVVAVAVDRVQNSFHFCNDGDANKVCFSRDGCGGERSLASARCLRWVFLAPRRSRRRLLYCHNDTSLDRKDDATATTPRTVHQLKSASSMHCHQIDCIFQGGVVALVVSPSLKRNVSSGFQLLFETSLKFGKEKEDSTIARLCDSTSTSLVVVVGKRDETRGCCCCCCCCSERFSRRDERLIVSLEEQRGLSNLHSRPTRNCRIGCCNVWFLEPNESRLAQ